MLPMVDKTIIFASIAGFIGLLGIFLSSVALLKIRQISRRNEIMFSGKQAKSLESLISDHSEAILNMDKEIQELFEISNRIHNLASKGIHKIGVIRFNPFKDIGGNQSFVVALLDGKNTGLVISSLHTREGTRVYSKPITKGKCEEYQLTEEESTAISAAMLQKGTKI
ncbi:MAG: hypothetical protein UY41_C0029G0009 [Candidatus Moranbacteria bacterium GW2011_GWE1_49_15]|nr:MAG: hypothetical protein UX75_C0033G0008 [Candidatus Moranbacteria bacterium GW2011_GWE2_47_10]KKW06334.1 MAG: hypothetical protein UY41_C0029G0009 [Candidatus Moranbacteria bacterium GW2011_GWE1_49_15]HBP01542.1 hypothetical protein [Candidatus Moranbacteria bacterium]